MQVLSRRFSLYSYIFVQENPVDVVSSQIIKSNNSRLWIHLVNAVPETMSAS